MGAKKNKNMGRNAWGFIRIHWSIDSDICVVIMLLEDPLPTFATDKSSETNEKMTGCLSFFEQMRIFRYFSTIE